MGFSPARNAAAVHPTHRSGAGRATCSSLLLTKRSASAAAPDDAGAWGRVELAEALVGALDTDPSAAAYEATYCVHRAVGDHDAVLGLVGATTTPAPPI